MTDKDFGIVFPFVLRRAMKRRGFTQKTLAEKSGVSEVSICRYIKGRRIPNARDLYKIASALNCSVDEIIMIDDIEAERIKRLL